MSLYSDLSEVLTPYANKIKELNGSLGKQEKKIKKMDKSLKDLSGGVPLNVREAIYTILNSVPYITTGLTDEKAILEAWAADSGNNPVYVTTDDILMHAGLTGMTIVDGSIRATTYGNFSVLEIDPDVFPLKMTFTDRGNNHNVAAVYKKVSDGVYLGDVNNGRYRFTLNEQGTLFSASSAGGTLPKTIIGTFNPQSPFVVYLDEGVLILKNIDGSGEVRYSNANTFGVWYSNANGLLITNCEVERDDLI